ncbi:MAG: hypothetical protein EXR69_05280 [Myxococcales bacterium]|nr:hypothetical protein [Myxococcales bacterium]
MTLDLHRSRSLLVPLSVALALSLCGCDQIASLLDRSPAPVVAPVAPVEAPKPAGGASAFSSGKFVESLPEFEKAVAAAPADDAAWDTLELAAVRGNQGAALLDRLSADTAIGGRVDRHQALRAELALAAGRASDALSAARALEAVSPGDAAALTVRAIRAGAAKPDGLPAPTEALWKAAGDKAAAIPAEVAALAGARAALLRAEIKAERGDAAGAMEELAAAKATGLLGQRVALAQIGWEADPLKGWAATTSAVDAAVKAQDYVGAARLLNAGRGHAYGQWQAKAVLEAASAARKTAEERTNTEAVAWCAAVQADAHLHLGSPGEAKEAATLAAAQPGAAAIGKWRLALAESMLGSARGVAAAAAGLSPAEAKPIQDLAAAMNAGQVSLPTAGLSGDDAAWQAMLGAGWVLDTEGTAARGEAAASSPDLKLWGKLWSTRGPVTGSESAPMAAENAVRAFVTEATPGEVVDGTHPYAAHWRATVSRGKAEPGEGDVAAFTRLISTVEGAFADQAGVDMNDLSGVLADWRSGPLSPVVVMDGPRAVEIERIAVSPSRLTDDDALPLRASWHAWRQRDEDRKRLWTHGVSPVSAGLGTSERAAALWSAVAKQRAGVLAWLAGNGAYPTESWAAVDTAAVGLKLLNKKVGTLQEIRVDLGHAAVFSFVPATRGGWHALYLTDHGHKHMHVDQKVAKDVADYIASVESGKASLAVGNRVRAQLVDAASAVLSGYGNYYVIGPAPMGALPVAALPEQSEGLRYLAEIRHTFYYSNFSSIRQPTFADNDFVTTMLAVVGDAAAGEAIKRVFPDAVILQGKDATRDAWIKEAPRSRYVHFQGVENSASGGFVMPAGGTMELSDIALTPLVARAVSVVTPSSNDLTLARMSAFRAAGAGDYFTTGVSTNAVFNRVMSDRFWDSTNKRLPVWKAVAEPRMQIAIEMDGAQGTTHPGLWGAVMSAGRLQ